MFYSENQIERANSYGIIEYFRRNGYSCEREGREIHIHGFGGLKVKEETQEYYIHSRHIGGRGLVSCLMNALGLPFKEAVRLALDGENPDAEHRENYASTKRSFKVEDKPLVIPQKSADNKRIYAYLSKERNISPMIISELVSAGLLYQDDKGNAVFLHRRDNVPCGAEIHGTGRKKYAIGNTKYTDIKDKQVLSAEPFEAELLSRFFSDTNVEYSGYIYKDSANIIAEHTDFRIVSDVIELVSDERFNTQELTEQISKKLKNFKGVSQGTTDSYFEYDSGIPDTAYVFESSIDLMSFMQLHPNLSNCKYVAMAGLKPTVIEKLLDLQLSVILCVDNDNAGQKFCKAFSDRCSVATECYKNGVKDYNELLMKRYPRRNFISAVKYMSRWADAVNSKERQGKVYDGNKSFET